MIFRVDKNYNHGFMFRDLSLPKVDLDYLLKLPEFVNQIDLLLYNNEVVDDVAVYNVVKSIYFPMQKCFDSDGFKSKYKEDNGTLAYKEWSMRYRVFGRATRRFSKSIFGYDKWEEDYKEYLLGCE